MENKVTDNVIEFEIPKAKKHIFISGSIGVGKTTLISSLKLQLEDKYGFTDELLEDELIDLFYDDLIEPKRSIELNLQLKKFHQTIHNEYRGKKQLYIYDRGIVDPITFSSLYHKYNKNANLKREIKYIINLVRRDLNSFLKERSYLILLDDKTADIWKRIEGRNRDFEKNLPLYLVENFTKFYLKLATKLGFKNVYVVNVNGLSKEQVVHKVGKIIKEIDEI